MGYLINQKPAPANERHMTLAYDQPNIDKARVILEQFNDQINVVVVQKFGIDIKSVIKSMVQQKLVEMIHIKRTDTHHPHDFLRTTNGQLIVVYASSQREVRFCVCPESRLTESQERYAAFLAREQQKVDIIEKMKTIFTIEELQVVGLNVK